MYKILIVDDDFEVRNTIKNLLLSQSEKYFMCGECINGEDAIYQIRSSRPDIIISDIEMPVKNGVDLLLQVNKEFVNIKMIMISNYDDFDYVKETLRNGAVDYILKHTLSAETLFNSLTRATAAIITTDNSPYKETSVNNNIYTLRERFLLELLAGKYSDIKEIKHHIKLLNIDLSESQILPIIMVIDHYKLLSDDTDFDHLKNICANVQDLVSDIISKTCSGSIVHMINEKYVILLSFSNMRSTAKIQQLIQTLIHKIRYSITDYLNIYVSFCYGDICPRIIEIPTYFRNTRTLLEEMHHKDDSYIIHKQNYKDYLDKLVWLDSKTEQSIISLAAQNKRDSLIALINGVFNSIEKDNLSFSSCQILFNDLFGLINKLCKKNSIEINEFYSDIYNPVKALEILNTTHAIRKYILQLFSRFFNIVDSKAQNAYSPYVQQAINYIQQNFTSDISLTDLSDKLKIKSSYLSHLFHNETGVPFVKYINRLRIEYAKTLLVEDSHSIGKVVELCGFNSYNYFINTFKKVTGITPKKYQMKYKKL